MNIKTHKGIFIDKEGISHPFGTMKLAHASELKNDNYHDDAFKKDILNTDWFQNLNFEYSGNINADIKRLAQIGIITIINACSLNPNGTAYNAYVIEFPQNLTDKQKQTMQQEYQNIKTIIDNDEAYLFAEVEDGKNNQIYFLDEFYDYVGLNQSSKTLK